MKHSNFSSNVDSIVPLPLGEGWGGALGLLLHYLKIAFRNLWKYKSQSVVNILGLAFGLACFVFGWYWLHWETSFDRFFPNAPNIGVVTKTGEAGVTDFFEYKTACSAEALPEIVQTTWVNQWLVNHFQCDNGTFSLNFADVDSSFVNIFSFDFTAGSAKEFKKAINGMILTQTTATRLFGNENPVGKQVLQVTKQYWEKPKVSGHTVKAVIKDLPGHTNFNFDLLINAGRPAKDDEGGTMFCLLHPGSDLKKMNDRLSAFRPNDESVHLGIVKLNQVRPLLREYNMKYGLSFVRIFAIASLLALIGSIFNFISLTISRTTNRNNEFRLRKTLGSGNGQLALLLISEIILSVLMALIVSVGLVTMIRQPFENLSGADTHGIYIIALWSGIWCLALTGVLFVIFRANILFRFKFVSSNFWAQRLMCTGQIAIASLFMIVALITQQQTKYLTTRNIGMDIDGIADMNLGFLANQDADPATVKSQLSASPYVSDVLVFPGSMIKYPGSVEMNVSWDGKTDDQAHWNTSLIPDHRFFDFFKAQLKNGRFINETDMQKCVINETAAHQIGHDVIGKRLTIFSSKIEIVGVVNDMFSGSAYKPVQPMAYVQAKALQDISDKPELYYYPYQVRYYIKISPQHRSQALAHIQQVMNENKADDNMSECILLEDQLAEIFRPETLMLRLFRILTATSLLISVFGIYSMVSLVTRRRRKEIAIRKVSGAEASNIAGMFFREYLGLTIVANVIALPIASGLMAHWLKAYAHHINITWWMFAFVLILTLSVVLLTVLGQVLKAANSDPAEVVKYE